MRLDQAKDRSIQKYLETCKILKIVANLKLAQERGLQFYQTRSHAIVLYNTLPAVHIEKAVCMKTKENLPKGSLNSKNATGCTQSEFALRSKKSTTPRRKILGPTQRIEELQGNLEQRRGLQNSWLTFRQSNSRIQNEKQGQRI